MNATNRLTKMRKAQGRKQNDTQTIDYIGDIVMVLQIRQHF